MFRTPQFMTEKFESHSAFLDDTTYGAALDNLVKACSDVLIESADGKSVFLGQRSIEPQPDWWLIGGRSRPGESQEQAASRNVKRELGITVEPDRFRAISTFSLLWGKRRQEPVDHGTAEIDSVHALRVTDDELSQMKLEPDEYRNASWFPIESVLSGDFHPGVKQAARDLLTQRAFRELQAAVRAGGSNRKIAQISKRLIRSHERGTRKSTSVRFQAETGTYEYDREGSTEAQDFADGLLLRHPFVTAQAPPRALLASSTVPLTTLVLGLMCVILLFAFRLATAKSRIK
ncbi:hypothetical protein CYMTET_33515 [Cymbomonas tetramitiformis]|uniref:Nudix hydrolase domain-containing protein n=1 Tax=Cymbomonas tetramitiformis TaxID=36881 RepID=A0AAE0FCW2_9CHLO|nr:hypothetical protein CYMTET_33515 [Cymbomonas tetramitiformis]